MMGYKKHKDLTKCLASFKLKITGQWYVHSYIWHDRNSMHEALGNGDDYRAIYISLPYMMYEGSDWTIPVTGNKIGELHFSINAIGAGIFAHELLHFLFDWIEKSSLDIEEDEESLAQLFGHMTARFWSKYYELFS